MNNVCTTTLCTIYFVKSIVIFEIADLPKYWFSVEQFNVFVISPVVHVPDQNVLGWIIIVDLSHYCIVVSLDKHLLVAQ